MMRRTLLLLMLTLLLGSTQVRATEVDSLSYTLGQQRKLTWVDRAPVESAVGIILPIVAYDFLHFRQDSAIKGMREQYLGSYHNRAEDFMIPLPLLTVWGLRLGGVEGRSTNHIEAFTAQGVSVGLTIGITQAVKELTKRMRPDGSTANSFPSGHTALAFATAAILDAEYGSDYPWVAAMGYGVATCVGVARIANDRHWATDVVTGAGVGVFSTYVGYLLNDLMWGRGLERFTLEYHRDNWASPYYLSIQKGFTTLLSSSSGYEASRLGNSIALTARMPLYREIGVRASGRIYTSSSDGVPMEYLHGYSAMVGADYIEGFWNGRLWLDGNISIGYLSEMRLSEGFEKRSNSIPFTAPGVIARVGVGATLLTTHHFAVQLDGGYSIAPLSRPYSRKSKRGLSGIEFGIGMTYVIH